MESRHLFESPGGPAGTVRPVRVVIADDEGMFRTCLRQLLAVPPSVVKDVYGSDVGPGFEVIGEAATGQGTIETVQSMNPDLLLLDISMPRMSGLDALRELQRAQSAVRTIILSGALEQSQLLTAIQLGARGLVPKDSRDRAPVRSDRVRDGRPVVGRADAGHRPHGRAAHGRRSGQRRAAGARRSA